VRCQRREDLKRGCAPLTLGGTFSREGAHPKEVATSLVPCVTPPILLLSHMWHIVELWGVVSLIPLTLITLPLHAVHPPSLGSSPDLLFKQVTSPSFGEWEFVVILL
jgi:hypothetical protein